MSVLKHYSTKLCHITVRYTVEHYLIMFCLSNMWYSKQYLNLKDKVIIFDIMFKLLKIGCP